MDELFYRIVNIEREDRIIYLVTRTSKGERKIWKVVDYYPSMYVRNGVEIPEKYKNRIYKRITGPWKSLEGGYPMDKVYTKLPDDVSFIRKELPDDVTGESDVIYTTRFLVDKKIRSGYFILSKPGTIANANRKDGEISHKEIIPFETNIQLPIREIELDIESVDNQTVLIGFWDSFTDEIYSIGWHKTDVRADSAPVKDLNNKDVMRNVYVVPHPRDMLNITFQLIKKLQPDVMSGWNIVGYDVPMMWREAKLYGINFAQISPFGSAPAPEKVKGLSIFDMYNGYLRITAKQLRSYKLVNIMKTEYGKDIAHDPMRIPQMWKKDFQELIDYNTTHVDACRYISKKIDVLEFIYQIVYTCCCRFDDADLPSRLIDALLLSVKNKNVILPNKPQGYKKEKEAQGAIVIEPVPGRYGEYILIFDASRLYPSIFLTFNFGTDTLDHNGDIKVKVRNPDGTVRETVRFSSSKKSEISQAFLFLFDLRNRYEKELEDTEDPIIKAVLKKKIFAVKIVTNAIYGLVGNPGFRLYKQIIQECVTQCARDVITWMQKIIKDLVDEGKIIGDIKYGDSVVGNTLIKINNKDISIENLFNKHSVHRIKVLDKHVIDSSKLNLETLSINESGKMESKKVLKIIKHKTNKDIYEITTESGKKIQVTEDEGLLAYDKNDNIIKVTPKEIIGKETYIPVMPKNKVTCQECGKKFKVISNTHLKHHNMTPQEYIHKYPNIPIISNKTLNKKNNKTPWNKDKPWNKKMRKKLSIAHIGQKAWNAGLTKKDLRVKQHAKSVSIANLNMSKEGRANISNAMLEKWSDDEYVKLMTLAHQMSPNKLEQKFICNFKCLKFTGDGRLIIGQRCPDFKVKGKKRVIEIFGDYWHKNENPLDKINHYKKYGWKCIVIWENEIRNNFDSVCKKVNDFAGN